MALTVTYDCKTPVKPEGKFLGILTGTITFDTSYPTGGEETTDISKYFKDLYTIICDGGGGIVTSYDRTNNKLLAYWVDTTTDGAALAEVANETDIGTVVVSFVALGRI